MIPHPRNAQTPQTPEVGDIVTGGDVVGVIRENGLFKEHKVMVHPGITGRVKKLLPKGAYTIETVVVEVEEGGKTSGAH